LPFPSEEGADDVLTSLPSSDGSRQQSEADSRLAQARARMAPIDPSSALVVRNSKFKAAEAPKPEWHAPWKLFRVISGHNGWVR
jgi:pleiotropic regulator 1